MTQGGQGPLWPGRDRGAEATSEGEGNIDNLLGTEGMLGGNQRSVKFFAYSFAHSFAYPRIFNRV